MNRLTSALAGRSAITNSVVFKADAPSLTANSALARYVAEVEKSLNDARADPTNGVEESVSSDGTRCHYEGGMKAGSRNGPGVTICSDGTMARGLHAVDNTPTPTELIMSDRRVFVGRFIGKASDGYMVGAIQIPDGTVYVGDFTFSKPYRLTEMTDPSGHTTPFHYGVNDDPMRTGWAARPPLPSVEATPPAPAAPSTPARSKQTAAPDRLSACRVEGTTVSGTGSAQAATITFTNFSAAPVEVFWLTARSERVLFQTLPPNTKYDQPTFVDRAWVVVGADHSCLGVFTGKTASVEVR